MKDFFISYNSADKGWAEWIAWQLEVAGYTTILQAWDFRPGHNFMMEMDEASRKTERTIAVLSPYYFKSAFCKLEAFAALVQDPASKAGRLLPIRVREFERKGLMRAIVYVDLLGLDEEAARKALIEGVKFERAKPTTPPAFPASRSVKEKPRFPGALPPIWNVPYNRNPNFTGRESLLADLRSALTYGQTVALHGLGGIGKTQIAIEYINRHKSDYQIVWWIRSEGPSTLSSDYADLADDLNLPKMDDQRDVIRAVRLWLGRNEDWLLIFDNADMPADIRDYLPQGGRGHVIVTSRDSTDWGSTATALEVKMFDRAESIEFLLKRTKVDDKDAAGALAEELGGLPLALEQAGAYILATGIELEEYLDLFQTKRKELWKDEKMPADYRDKVDTTWNLAMDRVKEEATEGADLLNLCAFLAPDDIPRSLFGEGNEHLPETLTETLAVNRAVEALRRYSLINASPKKDKVSVHRLVQAVTRDRLSDEERKRWAEAAVRLMNEAFPFQSNDTRTWSECSLLLPHALATAEHGEELGVGSEATGRLLNQAGGYLWGRGEFIEAKEVIERALVIGERVLGPEHPHVAIYVNNLGEILRAQYDLEGAQKQILRALKIDEKAYGFNHSQVAVDVNNLGLVMRDQGDFEGAKKLFERALEIDEKALGSDHPRVSIRLNNLGRVLQDMGDLERAKEYFERALEINETIYGPDHPNVARNVNNLGGVLQQLGELQEARICYERALKIDEKALGPDHPNMAIRLNNLGRVLQAMGDLVRAKRFLDHALEIGEKVYGPYHPKVAIFVGNLGLILQEMNDIEGSKKLHERALKICLEMLGKDHPLTKTMRDNLNSLGSKPRN